MTICSGVNKNFGRATSITQLSAKVISRFHDPKEIAQFAGSVIDQRPLVICFGEQHVENRIIENVKSPSKHFISDFFIPLHKGGYLDLVYEQLAYGISIDFYHDKLRLRDESTTEEDINLLKSELSSFIEKSKEKAKDKEGLEAIIYSAFLLGQRLHGVFPEGSSFLEYLNSPFILRDHFLRVVRDLSSQGRPVITYGGGLHILIDPPDIEGFPDVSFVKPLITEDRKKIVAIDLISPEYVVSGLGSHYENFVRFYSDPHEGKILQYGENQYAIVYPGRFKE